MKTMGMRLIFRAIQILFFIFIFHLFGYVGFTWGVQDLHSFMKALSCGI